jgi:CheY-like chemotaxis protein
MCLGAPDIGSETQEMVLESAELQLRGIPVAPFLGKRIVMVDDGVRNLQMFGPLLEKLVGEKGQFTPVLHREGDVSPSAVVSYLRDKVLDANPDMVLMDYYLDSVNNGGEVIAAIKALREDILCIVFSGDRAKRRDFQESGADAFVWKNFIAPINSLRELADVLQRLE